MKKLMITLTAAIVSAFATAAAPTAQVYDVTFKVKSTAAASASVNNKQNHLAVSAEDGTCKVTYRKQSTSTWKGLIWGCGCESIDGKWENVVNDCEDGVHETGTIKGCIIWDTATKVPVYLGNGSDLTDAGTVPGTDFGWKLLHCINKDGKQVEGVFALSQNGNVCDESGILFEFVGGGFGTACVSVSDGEPDCLSYIKSMSGSFAGYMKAPSKTTVTEWSGCTYCGLAGGEVSCELAEAWQWCDWNNYCNCSAEVEENLEYTAAYGTWTVKYNNTLSKKLAQPVRVSDKGVEGVVVSIRDVYDFSKLPYVEAAIEAVENKMWGVKSACDVADERVQKAKAEVAECEKEVADVSTEVLQSKLDAAKAVWSAANDELNEAVKAQTASNIVYATAKQKYEAQQLYATNTAWTIYYRNSSKDVAKEKGTGVEDFGSKLEALKTFTFISAEYGKKSFKHRSSAVSFVEDENELLEECETALKNAEDGVEYAKAAVAAKQTFADELASAYSKASRDYSDRGTLQLLAQQRLTMAKIALADAEDAYAEGGCN